MGSDPALATLPLHRTRSCDTFMLTMPLIDQPILFRRAKSCVSEYAEHGTPGEGAALTTHGKAQAKDASEGLDAPNSVACSPQSSQHGSRSNRTRRVWADRSMLRSCVQWLDSWLSDEECERSFQGSSDQSWLNQPISQTIPILTRVLCDLPNSVMDPETGLTDGERSARTVATCILATLSAGHLDRRMLPTLQSVVGEQLMQQPELQAIGAVGADSFQSAQGSMFTAGSDVCAHQRSQPDKTQDTEAQSTNIQTASPESGTEGRASAVPGCLSNEPIADDTSCLSNEPILFRRTKSCVDELITSSSDEPILLRRTKSSTDELIMSSADEHIIFRRTKSSIEELVMFSESIGVHSPRPEEGPDLGAKNTATPVSSQEYTKGQHEMRHNLSLMLQRKLLMLRLMRRLVLRLIGHCQLVHLM